MTQKYSYPTRLFLISLFLVSIFIQTLSAQTEGITITGVVTESGSGLPLQQVFISVSATGELSGTDENGAFSITVPDLKAELIFDLPYYNRRVIFLNGREYLEVSMVSSQFRSMDDFYNTPIRSVSVKDAIYPTASLTANELKLSKSTSFDQTLKGRVPGMRVIQQSGMPGQRTYMNIRGFSSLYAHSEPVLFIDGMIHDYAYANVSMMEGFALNPLDVLDIDDISDITVLKDGVAFIGSAGANGVINVNTEQKAETSTIIKFSTYGGITTAPENQSLLNAAQFGSYFTELLNSQGYNEGQINTMYPWLNGNETAPEYYRYNNNTNWQNEIYKPAVTSKHHFFLKGGDDIATYNLSTGYLSHNGIYDNSLYTRFNLRINGTVNISDKFTVTPNVKLSLADSRLGNHGPSAWKNPLISSLLIPQTMAPNARDGATGEFLNYLDDVGEYNVSNPTSIVQNAQGSNRNYHFLSSAAAEYKFTDKLSVSTLLGINFNNSRENIFLPDLGMVQIDSAYNSPGDFVYEFRSSQNHTAIKYNTQTLSGHAINLTGGFRYMVNSYKYNLTLDLNTPSDFFRRLGTGSQYSFLRSTTGDNRGLSWMSYFSNIDYSFRDRYFISANVSYDGNSATNKDNRYHFYPSVAAAWRVSSEKFLNNLKWLDDFKFRGSYSETGNMFSTIYDYSKLSYISRRLNTSGVIMREIIPNADMALERKSTINAGVDLSVFSQLLNIHFDVYKSTVDNLIIQQTLPVTFGYTDYFDNGGKLESTGAEISADTRLQFGNLVWTLGASANTSQTLITELTFKKPGTEFIVTPVMGAEYITSVGNPINAFYGYKTNGITTAAEAGLITGPNGIPMRAGDMRFVDTDGNNIINNADKQIIGDPNPDYFGSVFTGFAYKSFELSALFTYSIGNDVFNYVRYRAESMDSYSNQSTTVLERWTESNPSTTMPRASFGDPAGNTVFSDRWIEDGSYMKLEQLTMSYKLPAYTGLYKGIVVYVTATNLLTFTKYSGYDPEFMYVNNPFYMGIDYGKIPQTRSFVVGLKLDL